jgi:orotate phosphoribosyltransferase
METKPTPSTNSPNAGPGSAREALLDAILRLSFMRGRFQLSSGAMSDFYLDLRRTTLDPAGLEAAVAVLSPKLRDAESAAVGGPTLGADPLVAGLILEAGRTGRPVQGFLVRGAAKDHGTGRLIEGHCPAGARVVVLDDVVTRGGSILRAVEAVRAAGATPVLALALVDREEGGADILAREGVPLFAPFRLREVLEAAAARGL